LEEFIKNTKICNEDIKLEILPRDKGVLLLSDVVEPFYNKISKDNEVANFISDKDTLFKLKIKQSTFAIKFLTHDLDELLEAISKVIDSHKRIDLKIEHFIPYFFLWAKMIIDWLESNFEFSENELCRWRNKILRIYSHLSFGHLDDSMKFHLMSRDTPNIEPNEREERDKKEIPKESSVDSIINLNKIDNMHKSDNEKITAEQFIQNMDIDIFFLDELKELNRDLETTLYESDGKISPELIASITLIVFKYAKLLGNFVEFKELSYALNSLVNLLEVKKIETFDEGVQKKVLLFLEAIIEDLSNWQNVIFYTREANDIHYLDASIFSSCSQLEMMLSENDEKKEEDDGDDLELF